VENCFVNYRQLFLALNVAKKALSDAAPHGRDYYPQGDHVIEQAATEHRARMMKLVDVQNELITLSDAVQSQIAARSAR
jgi:hypothetical protein